MKSKKNKKLMPISSNTYILNPAFKTVNIDQDSIYCLFDLGDKDSNTDLTFNVKSNTSLTFYILSVNNNGTHNFKFKFNQESKSKVLMYSKCFVSNKAHIKLDGDIVVAKNTKEVIAEQEINGFVFSDSASISTTPALIIDTNNVKASHAVNIARIEPSKIFYLETKGFDKAEATNMLIMNEISFLKHINGYENTLDVVYNKIKRML
ncbi:MAG: SufD family Fe-S cluster assembly protein [Malacoplasma sp.]|nr:SufD family Fe-S cluster assembly protein [Malacoplasma sp.]